MIFAFSIDNTEVRPQVKVSKSLKLFFTLIRELTIDTSDHTGPYRRCHQNIEGVPLDYTGVAILWPHQDLLCDPVSASEARLGQV